MRAPKKRSSFLSKLAALYLIDFRIDDERLTTSIARQFDSKSSRYIQYRVGDRMLRGRIYTRATANFLRNAAERNYEVDATFRYLDFLTQNHGYDHPEVERISRRFAKPRFRKAMNRPQKIKASITALLKRDVRLAESIYLTIPEPYVRQGKLPVFLQRSAFKHRWRDYEFQRRGSEQYDAISKGRSSFRELIRNNDQSFCIVGNGPSDIGRGKGHLIDSYDVVIRINNYDLSLPDDYGTKQTVWVRVPNDEVAPHHIHDNQYLIIASNHFEYKRPDADRYLLKAHILERSLTTIPPAVFRELTQELSCLPSTGLAILYWLYKISGPIPRERIFGFSHFDELADFQSHYYADKIERRVHVHAWQKEMAIIARITR